MEIIWNLTEKLSSKKEIRREVFLVVNSIIFSVIGFIIWAVISRFVLQSLDWMICFIGYFGFLGGCIGGYIFLCGK